MSRHLLNGLAILACLYAASLAAQDREVLGSLLPSGDTPQKSPVLERYDLDKLAANPSGNAQLAATLERVNQPEPALRLRGAKEIALFRTLAPAVALIVTDTGLGSGSLIAMKSVVANTRPGMLLTNAHVVGDATEVTVVFKPQKDGEKLTQAHGVEGRVRKVDPARDLALVEVANVPAHVTVIPLGKMADVQVGADVHAIGHPKEQTWTYTKGLVSQIRPDYEWNDGSTTHKADVIQTQTPINPGNSGGPLIGEDGKLIGVNSFKLPGEALNFAVSVSEVEKFLAAAQGGAYEPKVTSAAAKSCKPKVMFEGRTKDGTASIRNLDMDCRGRVNASLYVPDDKSQPIEFRLDNNGDGKPDAWILDEDRDGRWDISFWDTDFDGKPDLVGHHPDGELKPTRFEKYKAKP
jgi:S1-C subfamily serine protease